MYISRPMGMYVLRESEDNRISDFVVFGFIYHSLSLRLVCTLR